MFRGSHKRTPAAEAPASHVDRAGLVFDVAALESGLPFELLSFVEQLDEQALLEPFDADRVVLPWAAVFSVLAQEDFVPPRPLWPLPPVDASVVPALTTSGSLSDASLNVAIAGWHRKREGRFTNALNLVGPIVQPAGGLQPFMLSAASYRLIEVVRGFQTRPVEARSPQENRLAWADVRGAAIEAEAVLDGFLNDTIVLRPRMLRLGLERRHTGDDVAIRITPDFEDAPRRWLEHFDRGRLSDVYKVVEDDGGYVEVLVDGSVAEVLSEIKRLPGRTVLGGRARKLVENPIAFFAAGDTQVFDEVSIEKELERLRQGAWRFRPQVRVHADGSVDAVGLALEPLGAEDEAAPELRLFSAPEGLASFVRRGRDALEKQQKYFGWSGLDVELDEAAEEHLQELQRLGEAWTDATPVVVSDSSETSCETTADEVNVISADFILDLSRYYERVEGIGVETPFGIISIPLSAKGAWLPDDRELRLLLSVRPRGEQEDVVMDRDELAAFVTAVDAAEEEGAAKVPLPRGGTMPLRQARDFVSALPRNLLTDLTPSADTAPSEPSQRGPTQARTGLLIKPNIDAEDFVTRREADLRPPEGAVPLLPSALRAGVALKDHQLAGLLWLQHLHTLAPGRCRGALLADDMGLGKTLQTLALIARAREDDPDSPPALVVAPVTLLENWAQEVERFFESAALPVLTLYGAGLREFRVREGDIDERLRVEGLKRFLRPGWQEGAGVVLTTYETLRDYEFSFADVSWSIVACDEAQRIKNPNALVTRAAKKLKANFYIAATGTPVENNLTDLWSLFDFIQPGLLEPLNQFNKHYRRPIEAKTEDEQRRVEQLRRLIDPQVLRRTKADVVKDLPRKNFDESCRALRMSKRQLELYRAVIDAQRTSQTVKQSGTEVLQAISVLRRISTDPRAGRELEETLPPLRDYRRVAPKLDWLITTLERIGSQEEKAIVFLDRKDIQRLVQRYVAEHFGFTPEIINGDTPTGAVVDSRQKRIDRFQALPGFGVLILSPVAAGVGLNIQAANHVIHYMRHWNPAKEDQATDRAYRIGQRKDVTVYTPLVLGDGFVAFDERLDQLLEKKRAIADNMLNGADDVGADEFADLLQG